MLSGLRVVSACSELPGSGMDAMALEGLKGPTHCVPPLLHKAWARKGAPAGTQCSGRGVLTALLAWKCLDRRVFSEKRSLATFALDFSRFVPV